MSETNDNQELPPGCTPSKHGDHLCNVPWGEKDISRRWAWRVANEAMTSLGLTLDEYKAMKRDNETMNLLRVPGQTPGLVYECGKWHCGDNSAFTVCEGWEEDELADDPADAIIIAFGT